MGAGEGGRRTGTAVTLGTRYSAGVKGEWCETG